MGCVNGFIIYEDWGDNDSIDLKLEIVASRSSFEIFKKDSQGF